MSRISDLKTMLGIDERYEEWQIQFCQFMSKYAGLGVNATFGDLIQKPADDVFFNGIAARTFRAAYDMGHAAGYMKCLHELVGDSDEK